MTMNQARQILDANEQQIHPAIMNAHSLYDMGLNVGFQPPRSKGGWHWRVLVTHGRMRRAKPDKPSAPDDLAELLRLVPDANPCIITGRHSGNLCVIDCETKESFYHVMQQFSMRRMPVWAVASGGRKGGGHFYFRLPQEARNVAPGTLHNIEIRARECYVLAPGAIHPEPAPYSDGRYAWQLQEGASIPEFGFDDLQFLKDEHGTKLDIRPHSRKYKPAARYLQEGASTPPGQRNNALFRAAFTYAGAGHDKAQAIADLAPVARASGLSEDEITRTIDNGYSTKRRKPLAKYVQQQAPDVSGWHAQLTGRTGDTDRRLLSELAELQAQAGAPFQASQRRMQELAGIADRRTLSASLRRLHALGALQEGASGWRVIEKRLYITTPVGIAYKTANYWCNCVQVLNALVLYVNGASARALAEKLGMAVHVVKHALRKLHSRGLVYPDGKRGHANTWHTSKPLAQAIAALEAEQDSKRAAMAARHAEERAAWVGHTVMKDAYAYARRLAVQGGKNESAQEAAYCVQQTQTETIERSMLCCHR